MRVLRLGFWVATEGSITKLVAIDSPQDEAHRGLIKQRKIPALPLL
jgi:hypothetical protein